MKGAIEAVGGIAKTVFKGADDLIESKEERQEQLSHRHEMDMVNGSWLTKNVRPIIVLTLLFYWVALIPILLLAEMQIPTAWTSSIESLTLVSFTFYFGSRGFEKVQMIQQRMKRRNERRKRKGKSD